MRLKLSLLSLLCLSTASLINSADWTALNKRETTSERYPRLHNGQRFGFGSVRFLISGIKILKGGDRDGPGNADVATRFATGFANHVRAVDGAALLQPGSAEQVDIPLGQTSLISSIRPAGRANFPLGILADPDYNSQLIAIIGSALSLLEGIRKELEFALEIQNDVGHTQGTAIFSMEFL